ncbi:hypothetical protein ACTXT7_000874 [Hymenolepis weldensis]
MYDLHRYNIPIGKSRLGYSIFIGRFSLSPPLCIMRLLTHTSVLTANYSTMNKQRSNFLFYLVSPVSHNPDCPRSVILQIPPSTPSSLPFLINTVVQYTFAQPNFLSSHLGRALVTRYL